MRLADRVAIVTGAASGNGRAIALRFADEGADLVLGDVDAEGLEATAASVRGCGRRVLARHCDVSKPADLERLFAEGAAELGSIDIVVANAGIVEQDTDCLP